MSHASAHDDPSAWGPPPFAPLPLDVFRAELLALYVPPLRAKSTHRGMRHMLDVTAEVLGAGATTADFTPAFIARLISTRPKELSPFSIKSLLMKVKAMCSYAHQQGYIRSSPFAFRKSWIRTGDPARKKHHSMEEIRRVLDLLAAEVREETGWGRWRARRLQALAATVAYTGMRKLEALNMWAADVDLPNRMLAIVDRDRRLKTISSAQPVPIAEPLAVILAGWMEHRADVPERGHPTPPECPYLFPNVTRTNAWNCGGPLVRPLDQLKAAGSRAGVEGFTFLSLRHSFATHAEHWGLSPAMIQRILRHTSLRTQMNYRHADADNLRSAVGGIGFGSTPVAPAPDDAGGAKP